jgi:branched-subunit amino acid ABC-type transport system permease component
LIDAVQNTLDGLMVGSSYALLALGFTLTFGVMRRLNLAYGATIMAGVYLGTWLTLEHDAGVAAGGSAAVGGAILASLYVERLCFASLPERAALASMVSSFAVWMQLEEAAMLALPRHTYPFPALVSGEPLGVVLPWGALALRLEYLVMLGSAMAIGAGLYFVLQHTRFGRALRATTDNALGARLLGIEVGAMRMRAFALAAAVGGIAGFLIAATDQQVTPMLGMWTTIKGLVAMMLGGLGSLRGAVAGGLLLGVVEAHAQWYFGPQVRDLVAFLLLFACLAVRPAGLLGSARAGGSHRPPGGGRG